MDSVAQIVEHKRRQGADRVETIAPDRTALDAARAMQARRIGSLVVVSDSGAPVGIVTERDLLIRVIAERRDPAVATVAQIMTAPVLTCRASTPLDDLRHVMRQERIRHVPVVGEQGLVAMLSLGDLNFARSESMAGVIRELESYITGG